MKKYAGQEKIFLAIKRKKCRLGICRKFSGDFEMAKRTQAREDIGLQIKIARLRKKMQQQVLAREIGIRSSRMAMIENGWGDPTEDELKAIKRILKVDLEEASAA
jgi:ribosome-binding protein aMBF1 (putative translation factor)